MGSSSNDLEDVERASLLLANNNTDAPKDSSTAWQLWLRVIDVLQRPTVTRSGKKIPLLSGLDRLPHLSAAEAVRIAGIKPPPYLCYMLSGMSCDILQFLFDMLLHFVIEIEDASLCWIIGFGLSIIPRHTSLRYMVFGDYVGGYWASLGRMYFGFSFSIVLSTVFNIIMTRYLGIAHYVAWLFTLIWTGIVNYFILKRLWSFGGVESKDPSE